MFPALELLNPAQREAVERTEGPVLILAGAGSGKTKVITTRIMYLIHLGVSPYQILAMTFTNKAAQEMKSRVWSGLGMVASRELEITTFHSFCARFLRREMRYLGRDSHFAIFDTQDQHSCLKRVMRKLQVPEKTYPPDRLRALFSRFKNVVGMQVIQLGSQEYDIYKAYQEELVAQNAVDFDDLLLLTCRILEESEECRNRYRRRFQYIMVDEYQDTNQVQEHLIRLLLAEHHNLCVVGDEDQSIYSWRGADIDNILSFDERYPNATVIKLEQNYRSTQKILDYANRIIAHNLQRKEKRLWTALGIGEKVAVRTEPTSYAEAENLVQKAMSLVSRDSFSYADIAVLFRANYLSRQVEEMCRRYRIPYQIIGGLKFYDRREIKDLLSYMRIVVNNRDWTSFVRAISVPSRGIGDKSVDKLYELFNQGLDLPALLQKSVETKLLGPKQTAGLVEFTQLYQRLISDARDFEPSEWLKQLIGRIDYLKYLEKLDEVDIEDRVANINELLSGVQELERQGVNSLAQFMDFSSLVSDQDELRSDEPRISMMTVHAAKGLEFDAVFVIGMEEGIFPNQRALDDREHALEEERRLFYVAVTRAKRRLFLSHSKSRPVAGTYVENRKSRFLELPDAPAEPSSEPTYPSLHNRYDGARRSLSSTLYPAADSSPARSTAGSALRAAWIPSPQAAAKKAGSGEFSDPLYEFEQPAPQQAQADESGEGSFGKVNQLPRRQPETGLFLRKGDLVRHKSFGEGTVMEVRGAGDLRSATIFFKDKRQTKTLVINSNYLEKI